MCGLWDAHGFEGVVGGVITLRRHLRSSYVGGMPTLSMGQAELGSLTLAACLEG